MSGFLAAPLGLYVVTLVSLPGVARVASLGELLRGERSAREEAGRLGLVVKSDGDIVELLDVEGVSVLGFMPTRVGILVYHVDGGEASFEAVVVEDASILGSLPLEAIVEDGRPRPPSVWLHEVDPELRVSRGRICVVAGGKARCKPF